MGLVGFELPLACTDPPEARAMKWRHQLSRGGPTVVPVWVATGSLVVPGPPN